MSGGDLRRHLGVVDAASILVGSVVGSGIFVAPSLVAGATSRTWVAILLWVGAGLVAACGALVYAECSTRVPRTGGFYAFQKVALGDAVAFVGGWAALFVTYPASIAAIALVFARYLGPAGGPEGATLPAVGALALVAVLNVLGVRTGPRVQVALTTTKVLALAALGAARGSPRGRRPRSPSRSS